MPDDVRAAALLLAGLWLAGALVDCERPGPPRLPARAPRGAERLLFGLGLDPNRASAAELEALPAIGPSRAAAIVAHRPYCTLAELERAPGIGPATRARITPWLEAPQCSPEGLSSPGPGPTTGEEVSHGGAGRARPHLRQREPVEP